LEFQSGDAPGPGMYDVSIDGVKKQVTHKISFPLSVRNVKIDLQPGPGKYEVCQGQTRGKALSTKFSKSQKSFYMSDEVKKSNETGPGQYEAKSSFSKAGIM
jgi:hypothetical protein